MNVSPLKWEVFDAETPPAAPQKSVAPVEEPPAARSAPFDLERALAAARGEGRAEGFEEGVARAEADFNAEMRLLLTEIAERVQDAQMNRAHAREASAAAMHRIASALLTAVAPAFARTGLADEVAKAAEEALRDMPQSDMVVRVSPSQSATVAAALRLAEVPARVEADPSLSDMRARIDWDDGVDEIDLDTCIARAHAALDDHFQHTEETRAHG